MAHLCKYPHMLYLLFKHVTCTFLLWVSPNTPAGFIYRPRVAEIHTWDVVRRPLVYKQAQFPSGGWFRKWLAKNRIQNLHWRAETSLTGRLEVLLLPMHADYKDSFLVKWSSMKWSFQGFKETNVLGECCGEMDCCFFFSQRLKTAVALFKRTTKNIGRGIDVLLRSPVVPKRRSGIWLAVEIE